MRFGFLRTFQHPETFVQREKARECFFDCRQLKILAGIILQHALCPCQILEQTSHGAQPARNRPRRIAAHIAQIADIIIQHGNRDLFQLSGSDIRKLHIRTFRYRLMVQRTVQPAKEQSDIIVIFGDSPLCLAADHIQIGQIITEKQRKLTSVNFHCGTSSASPVFYYYNAYHSFLQPLPEHFLRILHPDVNS